MLPCWAILNAAEGEAFEPEDTTRTGSGIGAAKRDRLSA